jgi:hypothetical protein
MTEKPVQGDYHVALTSEELKMMEQSSFNFFQAYGKNMRIPPKLHSDLKRAGVNMKYMDADPALEQ